MRARRSRAQKTAGLRAPEGSAVMSIGHQAAEQPLRVAVLGVGTMGGAMAKRLLDAGLGVVIGPDTSNRRRR